MNCSNNRPRALTTTAAFLLALQIPLSAGDDTEIFFGEPPPESTARPNVMFILDNSDSMSAVDRGQNSSRLVQMKQAFRGLLNTAEDINIGLMTIQPNPKTKSRMLMKVQHIDQPMNNKLATPALRQSGDDSSYLSNGTTRASDKTLVMGFIKAPTGQQLDPSSISRSLGASAGYNSDFSSYFVLNQNGDSVACSAKLDATSTECPGGVKTQLESSNGASGNDGLLLFRNLNVPQGVTIKSAKLILKGTSTQSPSRFNIKLENSKTASAINAGNPLSRRNFSNTDLHLSQIPSRNHDTITFDLTRQLQKLQQLAPALNPIGDVALRVRGATPASYPWHIGDGAADSPRLEISWSGNEDSNRATGLRFEDVAIPQGARLTSARIDFVPASSDDRPVTFAIAAQNGTDTEVFGSTENFMNRSKTKSINWTPDAWRTSAENNYIEGPDVTELVQGIVDRPGWCGNNSLAFFLSPTAGEGSRTAYSFDHGEDLKPVLRLAFSDGDEGCLNPIINISVLNKKDDGSQNRPRSCVNANNCSGGQVSITSNHLPFAHRFLLSRFQHVPVKKNAQVMSAEILATPNTDAPGRTQVFFENTGNSAALALNTNNLSRRTYGQLAGACDFGGVGTSGVQQRCTTTELKDRLQAVFNHSRWSDDNALALLLRPVSGSAQLKSREHGAESAVQLRIKLRHGGLGENKYTSRDFMRGHVNALTLHLGTQIVPALNEAARYYTQIPGKHLGKNPSPIESSCQPNYVVLLTDGAAFNGPAENTIGEAARASIQRLAGACRGDSNKISEKCGRTLARWMHEQDQSPLEGLNNIITHTIGFSTGVNTGPTRFLSQLASLGGGTAYSANNASSLSDVFNNILSTAMSADTTFVNASAPINSLNRSDNLDQLYFSMFRPGNTNRWAGNLKRYRLKTEGTKAIIVDADDAPAVDLNTGFFYDSARSFWNSIQDGSDVTLGGAAAKLPRPGDRNIFTFKNTPVNGQANTLHSLRTAHAGNISPTLFGLQSTQAGARDNLVKYINGYERDNRTIRFALGDSLHSSPRQVTYGCKGNYSNGRCSDPDITAILGTNEGFIHGFDTATGIEQFGFMPKELLPNIRFLRADQQSTNDTPHLYGMDNTATIWFNDLNNNGVIFGDPASGSSAGLNKGEFVYAYASQRRGGNNLYALDITRRNSPKLLWQINDSYPGFSQLGQTWSVPQKTKIKVGDEIRDVLIFAGGYDQNQDELNYTTSVYTADAVGNSIYIVDAKTGSLIWSASNRSGHTLKLDKMQYSIPSNIRVIDIQETNGELVSDDEKLADQFFVGDTGGQVWRFFINNGNSAANLVTAGSNGGVLASLGNASAAEDARKFFSAPDVAVLDVDGQRSLSINIGSGYRSHPLNKTIRDRFYSLRTSAVFADDSQSVLTERKLYNATQNLVQQGSAQEQATALDAFSDPDRGWFIAMGNTGEKILSRALTAGGTVNFNTYEPTLPNGCRPSSGRNRAYSVRLRDATPTLVGVGETGSHADRSTESNSSGIAGDPQLFCSGDNCWVLPDPSVEPTAANMIPLGKTYWMDNTQL
ncbi:conserved exported protein of unknown function [Pseudomonas marincola]|uniref:Type IV pilus assembly protein PilY1 n=1 Tax=Pseudomonas marincola TaxID=437900 RepID=A0A653DZQ9_9PSED|nr:hypothetical protein [Pseudomonas marincola]CAE6943922.1 conserved exported protein of unknown function [Pseudomonas marincola]